MRSIALLSAYLLCSLGMASAWPDLNLGYGGIVARADPTSSSGESATTGASPTGENSATKTATEDSKSTGTKEKEMGTATPTGKGKETKTKEAKSSSSIDPRSPAGGISMITPSVQGVPTYYKIGDYVTFAWNYTSLLVTPSAVNVVASCSKNSATYTISNNMSVEQTGKVVWDTKKYQSNATVPLLTATYTLIVYDANSSIGDRAGPGELSSDNQFNFAMYLPQPYTPLNEYHCVTCSGALSDMERQALKFAMGMVVITIATFSWFAGDFGVFST
ncbi:hypothetical protein EYZ11_010896 [Aspergillus tanneri]|uniref:DUF7137 domain-containing protein n=1 Tax=Aspergillus tanneri TaxID=1220188 RepID=A0A4S3J9L8_9EURO|nr:uncharacterized protein ATNIH1004_002802 [Aspergillus tanneri]KAA8650121.1 hypothetical protein ATNIH1004_002802 [Aspergillus tanneri]THC89651.1 hypothetical protein EYZ11_010896 [Aspergillus tanneri]